MRLKKILLISLALFSMVACSNSNVDTETTPEERDALKILEERREFYEKFYSEDGELLLEKIEGILDDNFEYIKNILIGGKNV